ncbi:hypothetical protein [Streptomyces sp. NPDC059452]
MCAAEARAIHHVRVQQGRDELTDADQVLAEETLLIHLGHT